MTDECLVTRQAAVATAQWTIGVVVMFSAIALIRRTWGWLVMLSLAVAAQAYITPLIMRAFEDGAPERAFSDNTVEQARTAFTWVAEKVPNWW